MIAPVDGMVLRGHVELQPGSYHLPQGLTVGADNTQIFGNGARLVGSEASEIGIDLRGRHNVRIEGVQVAGFRHGIRAADCSELRIQFCKITATAEAAPNTLFLDIWRDSDRPYGSAILLDRVFDSMIRDNDLQHQMNGILAYRCGRLAIDRNVANYCSGFGFHLFETSDSVYTENYADFCCRYERRGPDSGHLGADSAGFLIVHGSSNNIFRGNQARMSGDGFFLSGLTSDLKHFPCNHNLFEANDGSHSPNIAFEATFSTGNVFRGNLAHGCNYGFWLGFSSDGRLQNNRISGNRRAGIAAENAVDFEVLHNQLSLNQHGLLLWSKHLPDFQRAVPENKTSARWHIAHNVFDRNWKGIRIAANQDHGIQPFPKIARKKGRTEPPQAHTIVHNQFMGNVIGIELKGAVKNSISSNDFKNSERADFEPEASGSPKNSAGE